MKKLLTLISFVSIPLILIHGNSLGMLQSFQTDFLHPEHLLEIRFKKSIKKFSIIPNFIAIQFASKKGNPTLELYDLRKNSKKPFLKEKINCFTCSKDIIAFVDDKNYPHLYDLRPEHPQPLLKKSIEKSLEGSLSVNFNHTENVIAIQLSCYDDKKFRYDVQLIDIKDRKKILFHKRLKSAWDYQFGKNDALFIYSMPNDPICTFYNLHTKKIEPQKINDFMHIPGTHTIITICEDKHPCQIYDTIHGKFTIVKGFPQNAMGALFNKFGTIVATRDIDDAVQVYKRKEFTLEPLLPTPFQDVNIFDVSDSGNLLFIKCRHEDSWFEGSFLNIKNKTAAFKLYDLRHNNQKPVLEDIKIYALSQDEKIVAITPKEQNYLHVYDLETKKPKLVSEIILTNIKDFRITPDKKHLFVNTAKNIILNNLKYKENIMLGKNPLRITEHPHYRNNYLRVYPLTTKYPRSLLKETNFKTAQINQYGNVLAIYFKNKTLKLYNLENNASLIHSINNVKKYKFVFNGTAIRMLFDKMIKIIKLPVRKDTIIEEEKKRVAFIQDTIKNDTSDIMKYKKHKLYKKIIFNNRKKLYLPTSFFIALEKHNQDISKNSDILDRAACNTLYCEKNQKNTKKAGTYSKFNKIE